MKFYYEFESCNGDCDECRKSSCTSKGGEYEYTVDFKELREAVIEIGSDAWKIDKESFSNMVHALDEYDVVDTLANHFESELKEHFKDMAYEQFRENL